MSRSIPVSVGDPDKVTAWPFKEPEKTSAWKEEPRLEPVKDIPVRQVDHELEAAKARTAELKTMMAPPGALGLPPLLEQMRLKWGIPDGAFEARAIFDRIHIFPIDYEGDKETYGNSMIHRPSSAKTRDIQRGHRGVLISMGLEAMDHCISHGVELGHIVRTIRNAPHVQEVARLVNGGPMYILVMRDGDLTGSETLEQQVRNGEKQIVNDGGDHSLNFNIEGYKKKRALVADEW